MLQKILTAGIIAAVIGAIAFVVTMFIAFRTDEYLARVLLDGEEAADQWVMSLSMIVALIAFALVFLWYILSGRR